jgi:sirohydrochlorin cobaltochelatase
VTVPPAPTVPALPVLLGVAHGSRDPASQEGVRALLSGAAALRPGLRAADAYVDNASPSIRRALHLLADDDGVDDVVVVPLLLTPASHSKTDVAASVRAGRLAHPGLRLRYGRPLGPHPVLVDVLARRLAEAGARDDDPVVLVAGGALDPDANAQVAATARLLWEGRGWPSVDVAFASTTRPTVPEALERLRRLGHERVAVARYFLGPGHLPRLVQRQAESVEGVEVVVSEPLGPAPGLSGLLLGRYDEVRLGDIRMNCDACLYRIPLPGREHAVGAVQEPHDHPDDA